MWINYFTLLLSKDDYSSEGPLIEIPITMVGEAGALVRTKFNQTCIGFEAVNPPPPTNVGQTLNHCSNQGGIHIIDLVTLK